MVSRCRRHAGRRPHRRPGARGEPLLAARPFRVDTRIRGLDRARTGRAPDGQPRRAARALTSAPAARAHRARARPRSRRSHARPSGSPAPTGGALERGEGGLSTVHFPPPAGRQESRRRTSRTRSRASWQTPHPAQSAPRAAAAPPRSTRRQRRRRRSRWTLKHAVRVLPRPLQARPPDRARAARSPDHRQPLASRRMPKDSSSSLASQTNKVHHSALFKVEFQGLDGQGGLLRRGHGLLVAGRRARVPRGRPEHVRAPPARRASSRGISRSSAASSPDSVAARLVPEDDRPGRAGDPGRSRCWTPTMKPRPACGTSSTPTRSSGRAATSTRRVDRVPDRVARDRPQRHDGDGGGGMTYTPPPGAASFVKAKLVIDGGTTLDCYFNPTEYSLTKSNEWKYKPVTGTSLHRAGVRRRPAAPDGAQPALRPDASRRTR